MALLADNGFSSDSNTVNATMAAWSVNDNQKLRALFGVDVKSVTLEHSRFTAPSDPVSFWIERDTETRYWGA